MIKIKSKTSKILKTKKTSKILKIKTTTRINNKSKILRTSKTLRIKTLVIRTIKKPHRIPKIQKTSKENKTPNKTNPLMGSCLHNK
jgi:hypothetical protein